MCISLSYVARLNRWIEIETKLSWNRSVLFVSNFRQIDRDYLQVSNNLSYCIDNFSWIDLHYYLEPKHHGGGSYLHEFSLTHFWQNFVKVTVLLNKLIWRNIFLVRNNFSFFHTQCTGVEITEIYSNRFWQKFRESNGFTKEIPSVDLTKYFFGEK